MKNIFLAIALFMSAFVSAADTELLYLSGTGLGNEKEWKFYCTEGNKSKKWSKIKVPSQWELQGFGEYTYGRWYKAGLKNPSMEQGFYEYSFTLPRNWKDKKVEIVFEGVMTDAEVKINGQSAGEMHQGGFYRFTYNINDKLKFSGKNKLEVKVSKHSADRLVNAAERRADWWLFGGIYRPVYLTAKPVNHIERIAVNAKANGEFSADIFTNPLPEGFEIEYSIKALAGNAAFRTFSQQVKTGSESHQITARWENVKNWTPETPELYELIINLKDENGNKIHTYTDRIGFRTVDFRERDGLYVNGVKIVMKGINRHSFHPDGGRTTNKDISIQDVKLMKEMNINAVRFHYPPDKHFLDVCDSLGLFVVNELAGWQNAYDTKVGSKLVREMITRDVNHPSIIIWSNGNEGGWNYELDRLFHVYDPQKRHVIHAWADFNELDTHHYPAYQTGIARFNNGYKLFMPTEFMHGMYDQGHGAGLEDFWNKYTQSPLFVGAFMWDFSDNAVKRVDKGGILDSEMYNATDGILGPYREKEGSYYTVREIWSPVKIRDFMITPSFNGDVFVSNDYLFLSLEGCKLRYKVLKVGSPLNKAEQTVLSTGELKLPAIERNETRKVNLGIGAKLFDGDVLEIESVDANGNVLCTRTFPVKTAPVYHANAVSLQKSTQAAQLLEDAENVTLKWAELTVTFAKSSGLILKVQNGNENISFANGPVAVGIKTRLDKYQARMEGDKAVVTFKYFGGVDSIRWEMNSAGLLQMSAVMLNRADFGGGFDDSFMEENITNFGLTFSYPEAKSKGMQWFGRGPYRVWKNRIRGTNYGLWQKDYNNTITGESFESLVYPEFKGYHANLYWATMQTAEQNFSIYSLSDGVFFRVFTPEEPKFRQDGKNTMPDFPEGDLSFLYEIPAIRDFKPIEHHGPNSQPASIRIKKGDEGIKMNLIFDFRKQEN